MSKRKKTKERSDKKPEIIGDKPSTTKNHHLLSISLILIISIAIYSNTLKNGFVYDDEFTIVNNTLIKNFSNIPKLFTKEYFSTSGEMSYRPVVTFTYFLDYWLYGLKSWGYHLTNVLLHAINGVILYIFLTLLFIQPSQSSIPVLKHNGTGFNLQSSIFNLQLIISLLFVAHPVLTEAVNAISFREDGLCFLFFISALILYIAHRSLLIAHCSKFKVFCFQLLSLSFYLLALLSKEMAITFPLIIILYQLTSPLPSGERDRVRGKELGSILLNPYNIGYILITLFYLYLRFFLFHNPVEENISIWSFSERLMTIPYLILKYIVLLIAPVSLSADYIITPVQSLISINFIIPFVIVSVLMLVAVNSVRASKTQSPVTSHQLPNPPQSPFTKGGLRGIIVFGILFLLLTLLPVYNIIPIVNPFAERYLYLPSVGFSIIAGIVIYGIFTPKIASPIRGEGGGEGWLLKRRNLYIFTVSVLILSIYSFAVIQRNKIWADDYSLWSDVARKIPESFRGHNGLGNAYKKKGLMDEAIKEYLTTIKIKSDYSKAHNNLGNAYANLGRLDEAIKEYLTTIKIKSDYAEAHNNLGNAYANLGRLDEAIQEFQLALRIKPDIAETYFNLGNAYANLGRLDEAIQEFQLALRIKPDIAEAHNNLGLAYAIQRRIDEAIKEYLTALKHKPDYVDAHFNLGLAYKEKGLKDEAIKELKKGLELNPQNREAQMLVQTLLAK